MHREQHTICTQNAHNMHTHNTENDNMQHTEQRTENSTHISPAQDNAQPQQNSTYDLHTYNFDIYHEQIYIKNSNTIELYTILQDKV